MSNDSIQVEAEIDKADVFQLAQFLKRTSYQDAYEATEAHLPAAEREERAQQMMRGIHGLRQGLAKAGYAPL